MCKENQDSKKACTTLLAGKVMLTDCQDQHGVVVMDFLAKGTTVTEVIMLHHYSWRLSKPPPKSRRKKKVKHTIKLKQVTQEKEKKTKIKLK